MKVLYVEDSKDNIMLVETILKKHFDIDISSCETFSQFTDLIDNCKDINKYDLVLCDHYFPFSNGDNIEGLGPNVLFELNCDGYKNVFIHFSSTPCPENYELILENSKVKFHSVKKRDCNSVLKVVEIIKEYIQG